MARRFMAPGDPHRLTAPGFMSPTRPSAAGWPSGTYH